MLSMFNRKIDAKNTCCSLFVKRLAYWLQMTAVVMLLSTSVSTATAEELLSDEQQMTYADATLVIKELHSKLLYIMQNAEPLAYQGRYNEMEEIVISRFDTPLIAKVIMSRYWRQLDEEKKMDFIKLFQRLSVATYASRFDGYDGESFVELSAETLKKGRLLIKTELKRTKDKPVHLDYLMHETDGEWKIISVIANGVNDLSLKRAEYATVIKDRGFDGLVEEVSRKIRDMEQQGIE